MINLSQSLRGVWQHWTPGVFIFDINLFIFTETGGLVKNLFIFTETGGLVKPDTVRTEFKFWVFSLLPGFRFIWPLCLFHTGIGINFINFERVLLLHKLIFFFFFFFKWQMPITTFQVWKKKSLLFFVFVFVSSLSFIPLTFHFIHQRPLLGSDVVMFGYYHLL